MTVTANTTRNDYTAGSAQSEYDYTFQLNEAADVDVYLDGVKQTLNTHYVVQNVGNASGGTIVFTLEDESGDPIHPTQGAIINIVMAMDLDRDTNYQPSGAFLAADVNNDFDRLWLATNQQQTAVNRALRLKDTDVTTSSMELPLKDDRKGKLLAFNATTGDPEATTNNQSNWDTAYNNMITSASFTGGNYTLTQQDGGTISTSLDGRYLQLTGGTLTGTLATSNIAVESGSALTFATSALVISSNGTESIIRETGSGDLSIEGENLYLRSTPTANYLSGTAGAEVKLYHNNSEKLATTSTGISVTGNLDFGDNEEARFGDSADLKIYHNGTSSIIQDSGTGDLALLGTNLAFANSVGSSYYATGTDGGAFTLYYNGSEKLATTSGGISVTGTITATGYNDSNWNTAYNNIITAVDFNNSTLTLTQQDGGTLTTTINGSIGQWTTSGSNIYYNTGNVGIGTTNPATSLHVLNASDSQIRLSQTGEGSYDLGVIDGDKFAINRDGLTNEFVMSSGNVGIGTTNPQKLLEVASNSSPTIRISNTRNDANWTADPVFGALEFYSFDGSGSGQSVRASVKAEASSQFGNATELIFRNGDALGVQQENMRINYLGNVGIGTTSPARKLTVQGGSGDNLPARIIGGSGTTKSHIEFQDASTTADYKVTLGSIGDGMSFQAGGSERMRIDASGNVGIGTSSPSEELHISSSVPKARLQDSDGTNQYGEFYHSAGTTAISARNNTTDGTIVFQKNDGTTTDETMRIDSSGNVGIGITSPQNTLDIKGTGGATSGFAVRNSSEIVKGYFANDNADSDFLLTYVGSSSAEVKLKHNGNVVLCESAGNVGINKTNPSTALDVSGTITATDYAGDGSTLTGVLSDVIDDTTPQLGGTLDANDKEIQNVQNIGIGFSGDVNYNIQVEDTKPLTNVEMVRIKNTSNTFGRVMTFYKSSNHHGSIGLSSVNFGQGVFVSSQQGGLKFQNQFSTVVVEPCGGDGSDYDNAVDLGRSSNRFDDIYATNSTIQTSDRNLKQDIESLTDAEQRVAVAAKGLLRKFRWISAVEEKGDDARIHFGIMAQDLRDAFTAEGLDAGRYAMFTSTTWWEHEGENYYEADHAPEGATEVTRLGVRYSELLAFIISAI